MLRIAEVGRERMFRYIRQYTLVPPTEIRQKRTRQKLKTFACKKETNKQLKTQLQQATTLLSSAYKTIVSCGKGQRTIQTHPLPLALCKPDGTMRAGCKSDFKDVMLELFPNSNTFTTTNTLTRDYEVIVDFLFQLHQPPPPDVLTYDSLAEYKIVINLGVRRGANVLRIIVDKPRYLPKPRQLLHTSRSSKSGTMGESECQIIEEGEIPSAKEFQKLLANKSLKGQLITFLMTKYRNLALKADMQMSLILDYEDLNQPIIIRNQTELPLPMLSNQNGKADYNIWYHVKNTLTQNILVIGNDTDIWVYGMALFESGQLGNKQIKVERVINAEYVDINCIVDACNAHPVLSRIQFPANTLATIYILTGGDYISHFYKTSKLTFIRTFIKHICNDGGLINMTSGHEGQVFNKINTDAWLKLVCAVYLLKHKTLFNSEPVESLYMSLQASQLSPQKLNLLKWLAYSGEESITNLCQWHDFTRRFASIILPRVKTMNTY